MKDVEKKYNANILRKHRFDSFYDQGMLYHDSVEHFLHFAKSTNSYELLDKAEEMLQKCNQARDSCIALKKISKSIMFICFTIAPSTVSGGGFI